MMTQEDMCEKILDSFDISYNDIQRLAISLPTETKDEKIVKTVIFLVAAMTSIRRISKQ